MNQILLDYEINSILESFENYDAEEDIKQFSESITDLFLEDLEDSLFIYNDSIFFNESNTIIFNEKLFDIDISNVDPSFLSKIDNLVIEQKKNNIKKLTSCGFTTQEANFLINGFTKELKKEFKNVNIKSFSSVKNFFGGFGSFIKKWILLYIKSIKKFSLSKIGEDPIKIVKAFITLFIVVLINTAFINISNAILLSGNAALGSVLQIVLLVVIGPIVEETAKQISIKLDYQSEFLLLFNAYEFSSYIFNFLKQMSLVYKISKSSIKSIIKYAILRGAVVGMHYTTAVIQDMFNELGIKYNNGLIKFIGYFIGIAIHIIWNYGSLLGADVINNLILDGSDEGFESIEYIDMDDYTDMDFDYPPMDFD